MSHSLIKWKKINEQNYKLQNCHLKKLNEKFWMASSLELIMCYPCLIVIPPYTFGFTWTLPRRRKPTKLFKAALFCYYLARNNIFIVLHIHLGGQLLPVTPGDPLSSSVSPTSFLMAVNCFLFSIGACCIEGRQVKQRCLSHITKEMKVRIRVYEWLTYCEFYFKFVGLCAVNQIIQ